MKPVMTLEAAAYHKLKKIKAEFDNQNSLIFQAEQQRGSLEIGIKAWSYMEILRKRICSNTIFTKSKEDSDETIKA